MKISDPDLSDLLETNFKKGTLVECEESCGFEIELARGRIKNFILEDYRLIITTDSKAMLRCNNFPMGITSLEKQDEVFYIEFERNSSIYAYMLAPKGIDVPKKLTYDELMNEILSDENLP
jgi:hypothetical protein